MARAECREQSSLSLSLSLTLSHLYIIPAHHRNTLAALRWTPTTPRSWIPLAPISTLIAFHCPELKWHRRLSGLGTRAPMSARPVPACARASQVAPVWVCPNMAARSHKYRTRVNTSPPEPSRTTDKPILSVRQWDLPVEYAAYFCTVLPDIQSTGEQQARSKQIRRRNSSLTHRNSL